MKKYRVLLAGKQNALFDDIFNHVEDFLSFTSSMRYDDLNNHIDTLKPEIIIFCADMASRDDINKFVELKRKITRLNITFVIMGTAEDCDTFQKIAVYMADMVLTKPIALDFLHSQILSYMREKEREEEEQRVYEAGEARRAKEEELARKKEEEEALAAAAPAVRKHILVIDDDPMMLKLIKEHLHENYDVATAISGKIAYKFLESKKTDLILLDYEMPIENGPMVLENLRKKPELSHTPVLFLTGVTDRDKIQQVLLLKPQGYLLKPIDKDKLLGTIEKFLG